VIFKVWVFVRGKCKSLRLLKKKKLERQPLLSLFERREVRLGKIK
jgi:hypothetical protein